MYAYGNSISTTRDPGLYTRLLVYRDCQYPFYSEIVDDICFPENERKRSRYSSSLVSFLRAELLYLYVVSSPFSSPFFSGLASPLYRFSYTCQPRLDFASLTSAYPTFVDPSRRQVTFVSSKGTFHLSC